MRPAAPLPPSLALRTFTLADALAEGISPGRLRASDVTALGWGIFRHGPGPTDELQLLAAVCAVHRGAHIANATAARLLQLAVPPGVLRDDRIHLLYPRGRTRRAMKPVDGRPVTLAHSRLMRSEVLAWQGIRMTNRQRTWLDLATRLPLDDLVAVGDQLVRLPRPGLEQRTEPWTTPEALEALLQDHPGKRGLRKARESLGLIRVGSDSPAETKLRLELVRAGLPEPELQVPLDPLAPITDHADLGYRRQRVALNYDGRVHDTYDAKRRDRERDQRWTSSGWKHLVFHEVDLREGFRGACGKVRAALATPPPGR